MSISDNLTRGSMRARAFKRASQLLAPLALFFIPAAAAADERAPGAGDVDIAKALLPPIETSQISVDGRDYAMFVMRPPVPAPPSGFPVLVVLDANLSFASSARMAWARSIFADISPIVVVGIGYPTMNLPEFLKRRMFDFTDPGAQPAQGVAGETHAKLGGADVFREKVIKEALRRVEATEKINVRCRTLFGQSASGLFAVSTLLHSPKFFESYFAASPALQFEPNIVLNEDRWRHAIMSLESPVRVRLAVGELEANLSDRQRKAFPEYEGKSTYYMISNLFRLSEIFADSGSAMLSFKSEILRNETHASEGARVASEAITFASECPNQSQ